MKKILLIVLALAVVAVVVVVLVIGNLGSIIKSAVESFGSDATQTQVTLKSADVSITSGEGSLDGLVIANPQGFATPTAFELGHISVKIDTSTVTSDVIVIKEVVIDAPKVTYELSNTLSTNLGTIQDNVDAYTKKLGVGGDGGGGEEETPASGEGGKKFIIENLWVRNGNVKLAATVAGGGVGAPIGEIHLQDIGKKSGGATAAEVTGKVLKALVNGALKAATEGGIADTAKGAVDSAIGGVKGAVEGLFGGKKK